MTDSRDEHETYAHTESQIITRLQEQIARLTAERDRLLAERERLTAERDEVRRSYCSLMEAYRGGDGVVTANKLGWGYLFKEDGK